MSPLVYLVLYGWIPAVLLLFATLPPRRAVVVAMIAAWLFLPVAAFSMPGLPDYTKTSATTAAILLGSVLFDPGRLAGVRPRWFDLPMLVWCVTPLATSLLNGLGAYDGLSSVLDQTITWGLPYLIGRAYLGDAEGLRELAVGIVVGGLVYVPLCLFEVRMSPQLHRMVYGFQQHSFAQTVRYGGYRPTVFMAHGLQVGMWMSAATLTAYWLWATGALRRLGGLPVGSVVLPALLGTALLCKSTGALALLALGIAALWATGRTGWRLPICCLVLAAPLYMGTRATGIWSGRGLVAQASAWFGPARAGSLEFRLRNEDILSEKALRRPMFGWGGWGRNRVHDDEGRDISITDGWWVIALGTSGLVGLGAASAALLLPTALLLRRPARSWRDAAVAPASALAVLLVLYIIDNLFNAMLNPIYLLALGGLAGFSGRCVVGGKDEDPGATTTDADGIQADVGPPGAPDRRIALARELNADAHRLKDLGRHAEAEAAWCEAAGLWAGLVAEFPDHAEFHKHWLDTLNDLAWFLASDSQPGIRDPRRAARLAEQAVAGAPGCGAYWNTLGAALYHVGDWDAALRALERSIALPPGGTAPDFLLMALIHGRRGDRERARAWSTRSEARLREAPAEAVGCASLRHEVIDLLERAPSPPGPRA